MNTFKISQLIENTLTESGIKMSSALALDLANGFGGIQEFDRYCSSKNKLLVHKDSSAFSDKKCISIYKCFNTDLIDFLGAYAKNEGFECAFDWIESAMNHEGKCEHDRDRLSKALWETESEEPSDIHVMLARIVVRLAVQVLAEKHQDVFKESGHTKTLSLFNNKMEQLIEAGIAIKTLANLIDKVGGEDQFKAVCKHQKKGGDSQDGVSGLLFADERIEFYFENRDELLGFIQNQAILDGHESKIDYVVSELNKDRLIERGLYSSDTVGVVLFGKESAVLKEPHDNNSSFNNPVEVDVVSFVVFSFVDAACKIYNNQPSK